MNDIFKDMQEKVSCENISDLPDVYKRQTYGCTYEIYKCLYAIN